MLCTASTGRDWTIAKAKVKRRKAKQWKGIAMERMAAHIDSTCVASALVCSGVREACFGSRDRLALSQHNPDPQADYTWETWAHSTDNIDSTDSATISHPCPQCSPIAKNVQIVIKTTYTIKSADRAIIIATITLMLLETPCSQCTHSSDQNRLFCRSNAGTDRLHSEDLHLKAASNSNKFSVKSMFKSHINRKISKLFILSLSLTFELTLFKWEY